MLDVLMFIIAVGGLIQIVMAFHIVSRRKVIDKKINKLKDLVFK